MRLITFIILSAGIALSSIPAYASVASNTFQSRERRMGRTMLVLKRDQGEVTVPSASGSQVCNLYAGSPTDMALIALNLFKTGGSDCTDAKKTEGEHGLLPASRAAAAATPAAGR